MRIGLYVDVAKEEQPQGVSYHILQLLEALSRLDQDNEYLLYYQSGLFKKAVFPHCPPNPRFRPRPIRFPMTAEEHPTIWWKHNLPWVLKRDRVDVFHGPTHLVPPLPRRNTIVTIHDLAYFKMDVYTPEMTTVLRHWTRQSLEWAGRVIALSKNTQADILALGVDPEKVRLIYGGGRVVPDSEIQYGRQEEVRRRYKLADRYILFVGTVGPRKNLPFLLRSFAQLKKTGRIPHQLVLVGKPSTASGEVEALIRELGIEGDVIITGYVDAWQVPLLYKMADVFVLPTLYEGFTLVTLEAMAYGVPVVATDTSSIREGVGDAALLVPVDDVDALAKAIERVLEDADLRRQMIERGKAQSQQFTWEECARQTIDLYQELYKETQRGILAVSKQAPIACGSSR